MFDLGDSRVIFEMERWKRDMRLPPAWMDSCGPFTSGVCVRGVRGEGVKGIRPPAVRVEKTDERLLTGVKTAVAIVAKLSHCMSVSQDIWIKWGACDVQYGFLVLLLKWDKLVFYTVL